MRLISFPLLAQQQRLMVHSGIRYDIALGDNWVLTPNFAASLYEQGGGKDLGHTIEFRSGLEFAYKLNEDSHLGLAIYHMSNASIGNKNPGQESVILSYSFSPDF
ncbi:MAG: acyloxyacyl hydrolase [Gammaproteobacteria bacterium]|nr:acyloxyacyl hydrolase [Gammaproteobacteria bacterium]